MSFSAAFGGTPENLVNKVKKVVNDNNGTFMGDEKKGEIGISALGFKVRGSYSIEGQSIIIKILEKPFFIPEDKIKQEINKMISNIIDK